MRTSFLPLLAFLIVFASLNLQCRSTRQFLETDVVADSQETYGEEKTIPDYDDSLIGLCRAFTNAVSTNDMAHINYYFPGTDIARKISPKETEGMSDKEIETKLIALLRERLEANIANLRKDAAEKGLKHEFISMIQEEVQPKEDPSMPVEVVTVLMGSDRIRGSVPITFSEVEGKFYIFEVLLSTNIFK